MRNLRAYSTIKWDNYFRYQESSYSKLTDLQGNPVGVLSSNGRWMVRYNKSYWQASRVIISLFGKLTNDSLVVDHIDGNSLNNDICNLRLVTQSINSLNKKKQSNNSTGITGVAFHKRDQYYSAYTEYNGKPSLERFYIKQHGDNALLKAIEARKAYEAINIEMTERHGI